jgi:hypothetical protein
MARRRHTPQQIIRKLREADRLLGEAPTLPRWHGSWRCADRPGAERPDHVWALDYDALPFNVPLLG